MKPLAKTKTEVDVNMFHCEQSAGQSILDHADGVMDAYYDLMIQLNGGAQIIELPP